MTKLIKTKGTFNPIRIKRFEAEQLSKDILILKIWMTDKSKQTIQIKALRDTLDFSELLYYTLYDYSGNYHQFCKEMINYETLGVIEVTTLNIENI
jgi:hypothetical protein